MMVGKHCGKPPNKKSMNKNWTYYMSINNWFNNWIVQPKKWPKNLKHAKEVDIMADEHDPLTFLSKENSMKFIMHNSLLRIGIIRKLENLMWSQENSAKKIPFSSSFSILENKEEKNIFYLFQHNIKCLFHNFLKSSSWYFCMENITFRPGNKFQIIKIDPKNAICHAVWEK